MTDWKNSVILFDKHKGITSYRAIEEAGRLLGTRKIGHSGTLDRAASGLLVICTGSATRLTQYFLEGDKRYTATIRLGIVTDTDDGEGEVLDTRDISRVDERKVREAAAGFTGTLRQRPPRYSALKIKGKRASDLARQGARVDLAERTVTIRSLEVLEVDLERGSLVVDVRCSKGTYIRSLARDLGEALGTGAHMAELRRTESGMFRVGDAATIEDLGAIMAGERDGAHCALSPFEALEGFGVITVSEGAKRKVLNGAMFDRSEAIGIVRTGTPRYRVADEGKNLIAIAEADIDNWTVHYLNVFNAPSH